MAKVVYEKRKTKKGTYCDCLKCDLGYRTIFLSFSSSDIAEILGCSVKDLYGISDGAVINLGELKDINVKQFTAVK